MHGISLECQGLGTGSGPRCTLSILAQVTAWWNLVGTSSRRALLVPLYSSPSACLLGAAGGQPRASGHAGVWRSQRRALAQAIAWSCTGGRVPAPAPPHPRTCARRRGSGHTRYGDSAASCSHPPALQSPVRETAMRQDTPADWHLPRQGDAVSPAGAKVPCAVGATPTSASAIFRSNTARPYLCFFLFEISVFIFYASLQVSM